jgi:hypothetical protein
MKPFDRIVQTIVFDSTDPEFQGEMKMTVTFETVDKATKVTIGFENIPVGIKLKDNEAGTESSLDKLAEFIKLNT